MKQITIESVVDSWQFVVYGVGKADIIEIDRRRRFLQLPTNNYQLPAKKGAASAEAAPLLF